MSEPIGRKTVRAAVWALFSAFGKRGITLLGITLLARVLAPQDFGLVAMAMVYLTFVDVIGDLGAGAALVYWPERRDDAAQTAFLVSAATGLFWFLATLALAPVIAGFFHEPRVAPLLRVLSVTILLQLLGNTHDALLKKDLRFRARSGPEMTLTATRAVIALVFAHLGFGAWSLAWGYLAGIAASTVLLWMLTPWRPSLHVPRELLRPMLRYGLAIVAVQAIGAVMFYADVVAIGRFLGKTSVGLYEMASRIPDSTVLVIVLVAAAPLFPAFSKLHAEGGDVKSAYLVATRCVASLTLPASLGLFFLSRPIVLVFFGPQWEASAPILSILAIYIGFRGVDEVGNVLKATGRTSTLVWLMVLKAAMLIPAVIVGAQYSAVAVAGSLAAVYGTASIIAMIIAARIVGIPLAAVAAAFARSAVAGAIMSAALVVWLRFSPPLGPLVQLLGGVVAGGAVYIAALRLIDPEIFRWMRSTLLSRGSAAPDARPATGS